jgi:uncharacterized protein (TIGR03437 family)
MNRRTITLSLFGLLLAGGVLHLASAGLPSKSKTQQITPGPAGPFYVSGNRILDSHGHPFLMRGTQLTPFDPATVARDNRAGEDFGPHSATSLSAIRLRFNLNTVRLPVNVLDAATPGYFAELEKVVRRANQIDLLVVIAAREPGSDMPSAKTAEFWTRCAATFKDYPNVMFDVFVARAAGPAEPRVVSAFPEAEPSVESPGDPVMWRSRMQQLVSTIRAAGATQPVLVMTGVTDANALLHDPNVVYETTPRLAGTRTDAQRDAQFGILASRVPMTANGWDLELNDAAACAALPSEPTAVAALVQANLDYFDAHQISWTVSTFEPGKMIRDLSFHDATTLENGWTCGLASQPAGLGRVIEGHMRASQERGLFVVSGSGGPDVARGGLSLAYGPIMAAYDAKRETARPPASLGNISIQVTDAAGVTRPAGLLWASAGWGQTNFVIPKDSAVGPATMTIVRDDGSRSSSNITIADTAPGFLTGQSCRGPALGSATETFRDGRTSSIAKISSCVGTNCQTFPIAMSKSAVTRVRLLASGFRYAASAHDIEVTIAGVRVPVVSYGPDNEPGVDFLTIEIPDTLRGLGETDLMSRVYGRPANAVRINLGGEKPVPQKLAF